MGQRQAKLTHMTDDASGARACRILLVEDDGPVRERLAGIIRGWAGGRLVASCATLGEATSIIANQPLDLLITDLNLPNGHGVDAIRMLRAGQPDAEAMVISVLADERTVIDAIEAGASGYLLKDSDPINIIDAVAELLAGRSPISTAIARTIIRRLASRERAAHAARDGHLVGHRQGFTYGELAERLQISKQTVPVHIKNIYRKLQANNRSEAVYEASRRGLIRL